MVCKICGADLTARSEDDTLIIDIWKEKLKNMSCKALYKELYSATMSHIHFAALELLEERGHSEIASEQRINDGNA